MSIYIYRIIRKSMRINEKFDIHKLLNVYCNYPRSRCLFDTLLNGIARHTTGFGIMA